MNYAILMAAMLVAATPALAVQPVPGPSDIEAARIAAERGDPWHLAHLGPVVPSNPIVSETPVAENTELPSAVPEPASWALMIGGLGLVGGVMRRRATVRVAA